MVNTRFVTVSCFLILFVVWRYRSLRNIRRTNVIDTTPSHRETAATLVTEHVFSRHDATAAFGVTPAIVSFVAHVTKTGPLFSSVLAAPTNVVVCGETSIVDEFLGSGSSDAFNEDYKDFSEGLNVEKGEAPHCHVTVVASDSVAGEGFIAAVHTQNIVIDVSTVAGFRYALHTLLHIAGYGSVDSSRKPRPAVHSLADGVARSVALRKHGSIPCGVIDERGGAEHSWRGQHIDVARHFFDVPAMIHVLSVMGRQRLNVLHWHLTDDQGWRIPSVLFPHLNKVGAKRGRSVNRGPKYQKTSAYEEPQYYTPEDIRTVAAAAASRGITIVPEVDVPGHATALILSIPFDLKSNLSSRLMELQHLLTSDQKQSRAFGVLTEEIPQLEEIVAGISMGFVGQNPDCASTPPAGAPSLLVTGIPNCMGGTTGVLKPDDKTIRVVEVLLAEVAAFFSPLVKTIHLGGDQAVGLAKQFWKDTPDLELHEGEEGVPAAIEAEKTVQSIHHRIMSRLTWFSQRRLNLQVALWDDSFLDVQGLPPNGTIIVYWRDDGYSWRAFEEKLRRGNRSPQSHPIVFAPKTRTYFNYVQYLPHSQNLFPPYHLPGPWIPYRSVTLARTYLTRYAVPSKRNKRLHVLGVEGCLWSELLTSVPILKYQWFPRLFVFADVAWRLRDTADPEPSATSIPMHLAKASKYQKDDMMLAVLSLFAAIKPSTL